jgi:hypothetical protein
LRRADAGRRDSGCKSRPSRACIIRGRHPTCRTSPPMAQLRLCGVSLFGPAGSAGPAE